MIGERLEMLRKEKGLSMRAIGEIIGVSDAAWVKYEKNRAEPSIATLIRTADVFGVTLDYLMCRTNIRDQHIIDEANIQNDFLRSFEAANVGNTNNMNFLIENLSAAVNHYNTGSVNEAELQLLLKAISEIILHFITLADFKVKFDQLNKEVLVEHRNTSVQLITQLNDIIGLMFLDSLTEKNTPK